MCCRYWVDETPRMMSIAEEMYRSGLVNRWRTTSKITVSGEIRPTDVVPVIAPNRSGERAVFPMKWGFTGKSLLMNARVETAAEKSMFRDAWAGHRCLVPASYYFEWEHLPGKNGRTRTGDKYRIRPKDSEMTWLCGLYRIEEGLPVFVILTRQPGEGIRFLHNRMPLILSEEVAEEWIRPDTRPESLLPAALTDMEFRKEA